MFDPLLATNADFPSLLIVIAAGSVPTLILLTLVFVIRSKTTTEFAPVAPSTTNAYRPSGVTTTARAGNPTSIVSSTACVFGSTKVMLLPLAFAVSTAGTAWAPATGVAWVLVPPPGVGVSTVICTGGTWLPGAQAMAKLRTSPSAPGTPRRLIAGRMRMPIDERSSCYTESRSASEGDGIPSAPLPSPPCDASRSPGHSSQLSRGARFERCKKCATERAPGTRCLFWYARVI